jgi:uncharacterized protein YajQ (UPF0234 family)
MPSEYSFDVVSRVDLTVVANAIDQAEREITGRFDFRNTKTKIELDGNAMKVTSDDEFHLNTVLDIIRGKFAKRELSLKALEYGKIESASGGTVRQVVTIRQGIPTEEAKKLVREIKASGVKVQAQIQGEELRVAGKDKDALQAAQKLIKGMDLPFDVAFSNYR